MKHVLNWISSVKAATGAARVLTGAIVVGVLLRVVSSVLQGDQVASLPGIYDQISYHALATRFLEGHGFTFATDWWPATRANQPTAQWSFLYTLYLAVVYHIVGVHPLAARLIQAIVAGILQPLLTWRIGSRIFDRRVGLIAAVLTSMYAYFVYYAGALMTETFYILAILWAIDLTLAIGQSEQSSGRSLFQSYQRWFLLGIALGVAALLRQLILFFVPLFYLWVLISKWKQLIEPKVDSSGRQVRSILAGLLVTSLIVAALIAPWTVRNYQAFHQFVLLNTNEGYVFFWANHPIYGTNFIPLLPGGTYEALIPPSLRGLDEATLDRALLQLGVGFVISDPARYALLSLSRVKFYFQFWPSADSDLSSNLARLFSFGILLPFMVGGLFLSLRDRHRIRPRQRRGLALLIVFVAVYSLIHLLSWTLIRYRLPVDAVLIIFAARALEIPISWFIRRQSTLDRSRPLPAAVVTLSAQGNLAEAGRTRNGGGAMNVVVVER